MAAGFRGCCPFSLRYIVYPDMTQWLIRIQVIDGKLRNAD
jgi:hypothetical protein